MSQCKFESSEIYYVDGLLVLFCFAGSTYGIFLTFLSPSPTNMPDKISIDNSDLTAKDKCKQLTCE